MAAFTSKVGDTGISIFATLVKRNGDPIPMPAGSTVKFTMTNYKTGEVKVDKAACVIVNANAAQVRYDWQTEDVDTAGLFLGEFLVTDDQGKETRVPRNNAEDAYSEILFEPNLA